MYKLLETPFLYSLSQIVLAPGAGYFLRKRFSEIFNESEGIVLDIGCGPVLNTPEPRGCIVGVDINPSYVMQYTGGYIDTDVRMLERYPEYRIRLGFLSSADNLPFDSNTFDEARSLGLLHHLAYETAVRTIKEMFRCTQPGGRIIILDNVWPQHFFKRPFAWLVRRFDRGRWVRTEEELVDIALTAEDVNWQKIRFSYALNGLEMVMLQATKSSD